MVNDQKSFIEAVYNLVGNEYSVLGKYIKSKEYIEMKHNKCGHIYNVKPNIFLKGSRCPKCFGSPKKSTEQFKKEIYDLVGNEYTVLGEYTTTNDPIKMKHNKCGHIYNVKPYKFLHQNHRCPNCSIHKKLTKETFSKRIYELEENKYSLLSDFKNVNTYIILRHNECNYEYKVKPKDFLKINGNRCPRCAALLKESKNVIKIKEYLNSNNISFITEKIFDECKNIRSLPFDFYLEDYDLLIEYDGEQHFKICYGDIEGFKNQQKRDQIKNDWCRENNKDLLRLNYKQDVIKILDNYLNENYEIIEE